jgi:flagellar motor protein MotB
MVAKEVEEFVFKNKLAGQVDVSFDERGASITLSDTVLFPAGKSRMTAAGNNIIKQVFDLLQQFNYNVKIEGHTDCTHQNRTVSLELGVVSGACSGSGPRVSGSRVFSRTIVY